MVSLLFRKNFSREIIIFIILLYSTLVCWNFLEIISRYAHRNKRSTRKFEELFKLARNILAENKENIRIIGSIMLVSKHPGQSLLSFALIDRTIDRSQERKINSAGEITLWPWLLVIKHFGRNCVIMADNANSNALEDGTYIDALDVTRISVLIQSIICNINTM